MKKTISILIISGVIAGTIFFYLSKLQEKTANIEKEISELKTTQFDQKKYINDLTTFKWHLFFNKELVSFKYPGTSSLCESSNPKNGLILNVNISFHADCMELKNKQETGDFSLKILNNSIMKFESSEDVLRSEGLEDAQNITIINSESRFPEIGEKYLTEWYSEKNDIYAIVILYPPQTKKKSGAVPIYIIKGTNYKSFPHQKPIIDLIVNSIKLP